MQTVYTRLTEVDEIRLLCLQPRLNSNSVKCTLQKARLSLLPHYVALSYMWGPKEEQKNITLNGFTCPIRSNLWHALLHLRLETGTRFIWADAICIDQSSIEERNHQVAQMWRIYSQAEMVIAWLGVPGTMSEQAIRTICHYGESSHPSITSPLNQNAMWDRGSLLDFLLALCRREYWSRLWIVQEILMAKKLL
ncbi:heterokaryon incompatibility protein-domain-containing protein, partial [Leptodontidium sp. 2 PMI_412]